MARPYASGLSHSCPGQLELSEEGKAVKFFEVTPFDVRLTPASIAEAATTLTTRTGELERLIKTVD